MRRSEGIEEKARLCARLCTTVCLFSRLRGGPSCPLKAALKTSRPLFLASSPFPFHSNPWVQKGLVSPQLEIPGQRFLPREAKRRVASRFRSECIPPTLWRLQRRRL